MDLVIGAIYHTSKGTMRVLRAHAHAVQAQIATNMDPSSAYYFEPMVYEFQRQEFVDLVAEPAAKTLFTAGWHCISGKHLRVARVADPRVRASFEASPMPVEAKADRLRRKQYATDVIPSAVETKTVDVDTYVALKKLRRGQTRAALSTFGLKIGPSYAFTHKPAYLNPRKDAGLYAYQSGVAATVASALGVKVGQAFDVNTTMSGSVSGASVEVHNLPAAARHEARYLAELEALPDSLFKRVRLRTAKLPRRARADLGACKKAFDREVAEYIKETLK